MHPLLGDLSNLKDSEIENKIEDLTKKYWMTYNPDVKMQIAVVLESYREELINRRLRVQQNNQKTDIDLDSLIKVN